MHAAQVRRVTVYGLFVNLALAAAKFARLWSPTPNTALAQGRLYRWASAAGFVVMVAGALGRMDMAEARELLQAFRGKWFHSRAVKEAIDDCSKIQASPAHKHCSLASCLNILNGNICCSLVVGGGKMLLRVDAIDHMMPNLRLLM